MQHVSAIFQNKMLFILGFKYYVFNVIVVTMKTAVSGALIGVVSWTNLKSGNSLLFLLTEE